MQTTTHDTEQKNSRQKITKLPHDLAEKIAAGEVIERPASAIKELIENSIDALATEIRIELEEGGKRLLAVIDNGHGIRSEELPLALERHATSKIRELSDLWQLSTMGFRGEALPSIAAISRFSIESKTASEDGRRIILEGGSLKKDETRSTSSQLARQGTIVRAEDLFFNVPARLKFQKTKTGEVGFVRELIERIALCHPSVRFTLVSEQKKSLELKPAASDLERFAEILEIPIPSIEVYESEYDGTRIRALLDRDNRAANARSVFLAVNGRMVRDKLLQQAVISAMRSRMMEGEFPRIFVSVEIDPSRIDVNVHPAKSEVRFEKARDVFQLVYGLLEKKPKTSNEPYYKVADEKVFSVSQARLFEKEKTVFKTLLRDEKKTHSEQDHKAASDSFGSMSSLIAPRASALEAEAAPPLEIPTKKTTLDYIGQFQNTYLLFQEDDGLVIVDQHAAHERVQYEKLKAKLFRDGLKPQPLLIAAVYKDKIELVSAALENREVFGRFGFEFEEFGDNALLIRECPQEIDQKMALALFKTIAESLAQTEGEVSFTDPTKFSAKLERLVATAACHSSVRAGQTLSREQAISLLDEMESTESGLNCPHGRPASLHLGRSQIEALFKRG